MNEVDYLRMVILFLLGGLLGIYIDRRRKE